MQWMWALLGVPASIAGFVIAHRINKRKPGPDTRGLYITMWLMILAVSASIFLAVAWPCYRPDNGTSRIKGPSRRGGVAVVLHRPVKDRAAGGQAGLTAEFEARTSLLTAQRPMAAAAPTVAHGISSQGCQPRPRTLPSSQNTRVGAAKKAPMWIH